MKYQYLKGSEKDFEGAPEWAWFAIKCTGYDSIDFAESLNSGDRVFYSDECAVNKIQDTSMWSLIARRAPITEPKWNGEGLPPVGCECEIKRVADWMPVTIKFISDYHTVFTTFGGAEACYQTCSIQFRPIRSESECKRDEFISYLHCDESLGMHRLFKSTAEAIYDLIAAGKIPGVKLEG